jgi:hypothetical protein
MNGQAPGAIHSSSSFSHFPSLYLHFLGFLLFFLDIPFRLIFSFLHIFFSGVKTKQEKTTKKKNQKNQKKEETQQTPKKYGGGSHTFHFRGPPFLFTVSNCFDSSPIES